MCLEGEQRRVEPVWCDRVCMHVLLVIRMRFGLGVLLFPLVQPKPRRLSEVPNC